MKRILSYIAVTVLVIACGRAEEESSLSAPPQGHYLKIGSQDTWLKKRNVQSSELDRGSEKCTLYKGTYLPIQAAVRNASGNHYIVNTRRMIPGCDFSQGYVYRPHVSSTSSSGGSSGGTNSAGVYQALANRIQQRAASQSLGRSLGQCWKYVNDAVTGRGGQRMGMSAMLFFQNTSNATMKNTFGLCKMTRSNGSLETSIAAAPIGAVIGYAPGLHGHHPRWGHGEVKVSNSRYCSDFCTNRSNRRASFILIPCARGSANRL
ncbi:MAG: hypothetical protein HRU19_27410 [Pseudobacteriovorax sp.]|nr:hypothetical protein [Pseudobacteriovorax sp.]